MNLYQKGSEKMIFISSLPLRFSGEDRLEKIEFKKFSIQGVKEVRLLRYLHQRYEKTS